TRSTFAIPHRFMVRQSIRKAESRDSPDRAIGGRRIAIRITLPPRADTTKMVGEKTDDFSTLFACASGRVCPVPVSCRDLSRQLSAVSYQPSARARIMPVRGRFGKSPYEKIQPSAAFSHQHLLIADG